MTEPFVTTDETTEQTCDLCGVTVVARFSRGLYGSTAWRIPKHDAPCGLPCLGGGVPLKVYRSGQVHKRSECPRCAP